MKDGEKEEVGGYNWDMVVDPSSSKPLFTCGQCKKLLKNAVDMSCQNHADDEESHSFCEKCVVTYMKANQNKCPVNNHENPTYVANLFIRKKVDQTKINCPRNLEIKLRDISHPPFPLFRILFAPCTFFALSPHPSSTQFQPEQHNQLSGLQMDWEASGA